MSLARYLVSDGWDYLLRGVRKTLEQRRDILRSMVMRFFPEGTRCSQPAGGYVLWVELPGHVDGLALHRRALEEGIAITPGRVFGVADRYRNCLRLNYSYEWTPVAEAAFQRLAALVAAATPTRP